MNDPEGSEYDRLFYPFLFEGGKANIEDVLAQVRHSSLEKCREVIALRRSMLKSSREQIIAAGRAMAQAFINGATLLAFGNGGSTTDAQDLVVELLNPPFPNWSSLPAIALTNDIAVVTAVANDVGFDNVYARQVIAFGRPGDIALGISTSGNSTNVLVALEQAKKQWAADRWFGLLRWWKDVAFQGIGFLHQFPKRSRSAYPGSAGHGLSRAP